MLRTSTSLGALGVALLVGCIPLTAGRLHETVAAPPVRTAKAQAQPPAGGASVTPQRALLNRYCVTCHNQKLKTAGLMLDQANVDRVGEAPEIWEKVVLKLRGGMMPPVGRPRPDHASSLRFQAWLEAELDRAAEAAPDPGRVPVHRLNRAEYSNAVRDLLALDIDAQALLPADESGHGFDNIAGTLSLSPALLERYLSAAQRISRLAVGDPSIGPAFTSKTYVVPINMSQNDRMSEDLPFGSRAGLAVRHHFPLDGEYHMRIRLKRSVYEYIVNLDERHDLDIRLDGSRLARFPIGGENPGKPAPVSFSGTFMAAGAAGYPTQDWDDYRTRADAHLELRFPARAGTRTVAASFVGKSWEAEGVLQPPLREYGATVTETTDTSARPEGPGLESVTIDGPYQAVGPGETPSRRRIFVCYPASDAEEASCARTILSTLARRAYRRPVTDDDIRPLFEFYRSGRAAVTGPSHARRRGRGVVSLSNAGFEAGVQAALEWLLIDPDFLFRIERDPAGIEPGTISRLSDLDLASRLSFFLWSSIPDEDLLDRAERGQLGDPEEVARQVRRMLADPRSRALVQNFAAQWLSLRSIRGVAPDANLFPGFDENLREAFQRETELLLEYGIRQDRSVVELLSADYTFLNERLAQHYGVPGVSGSRFRRVSLPDDRRGGLLGHASILTATSYGNRTSPVLRAKWLLENILGTPPPPPPPEVTAVLPDRGEDGAPTTVRERLAQHRKNPTCAVCHAPMDPLGFALENFDAIGQWRTMDGPAPVDASGVLPDGTTFDGPAALRRVLLSRREQFVETLTEKLLTYALGRGIEHHDRPVIRRIVREAAADEYRWSALILGIVESLPFRMRTAAPGLGAGAVEK